MKVRSFPKTPILDDLLNQWFEENPEIFLDRVVPLGDLVMIFYLDDAPDLRKRAQVMCSQCRKRPAIKGMKICTKCREYQADYRKKRKDEKRKARYP